MGDVLIEHVLLSTAGRGVGYFVLGDVLGLRVGRLLVNLFLMFSVFYSRRYLPIHISAYYLQIHCICK